MARASKARGRPRIPKADRKNSRLWAEGMRETILRPHIEPYNAALSSGWRTERAYLQKVCTEYHVRIDWRLPDHEEPESLMPFDPEARIDEELLPEAEQERKVKKIDADDDRIRRWLKYRARRLNRQGQIKVDSRKDPWAVLLAKLSGVKSPPKARQAYQQFMHEEYITKIAPAVAKSWAEEAGEGSSVRTAAEPNAPFRARIARELFANLPEDEQARYSLDAKTEAQTARTKYELDLKAAPSKTPEARHEAIEHLGAFLAPILQGIHERTGLHSVILLGGPMPKYGGALRTMHVSYGRNKTANSVHFPVWAKDRFNGVLGLMKEYLDTAFGPEDIKAAALPDGLEGAKYTIPQDLSDGDSSSDSDSSESDSDSDSDSASDASEVKRKSKKPAAKKVAKGKEKGKKVAEGEKSMGRAQVKRKRGKDTDEPPKKKPKRVEVVLQPLKSSRRLAGQSINVANDATGTGGTGTSSPARPVAPTAGGVGASSPAWPGAPITAANVTTTAGKANASASSPAQPITTVTTTTNADTAGASSDTATGASSPAQPITTAAAMDATSAPITTTTANADTAGASGDTAAGASSPAQPITPTTAANANTDTVGVTTTTTTTAGANSNTTVGGALPEFPADAPSWLKDAVANLAIHDLGNSFKSVLEAVIRVEEAQEWNNRKGGLPTAKRPTVIGDWVKSARGAKSKKELEIAKLHLYVGAWQVWWDSLQPKWRTKDGNGKWCIGEEYGEDWGVFVCPGINGVLNLAAGLYFWGKQLRMECGKRGEEWFAENEKVWDAAVHEVTWMLDGLCAYLLD